MIPGTNWWVHLLGTLLLETALVTLTARALAGCRSSATDRRRIWRLATVALLLVVVGELAGIRPALPPPERHRVSASTSPRPTPIPATAEPSPVPDAIALPPPPAPSRSLPAGWPGWLWLAGSIGLAARGLMARLRLAWHGRHGAQPRLPDPRILRQVDAIRAALNLPAVRVLSWAGLRGPIVFGIRRPTLVVPADFEERFSPEQIRAVLTHELSHLQSRDPAWLAFAQGMVAILWWSPLAWWAARELRRSTEAAADEASHRIPGGRIALAESLVILGRSLVGPIERSRLGASGPGPASELGRRVRALLEDASPVRPRPGARRRTLLAGSGLLGALLLAPLPGTHRPGLPQFLATAWADARTESLATGAPDPNPVPTATGEGTPVYHHAAADPFPPPPKPSVAYGVPP